MYYSTITIFLLKYAKNLRDDDLKINGSYNISSYFAMDPFAHTLVCTQTTSKSLALETIYVSSKSAS